MDSVAGRTTRWTEAAKAAKTPWLEYPRPQLKREGWVNLNGTWDFTIGKSERPTTFDRKIKVPYPVESQLSGIDEMVPEGATVWYRRQIPATTKPGRTFLNFEAVDWQAKVFVDGKLLGDHRGGSDPFSFELTDILKDGKPHELVVGVTDPTDGGPQPRGKQVRKPGGIFYRPTTGIWQTVWMETVPERFVSSVYTETKIDGKVVAHVVASSTGPVSVEVFDGQTRVAQATGDSSQPLELQVPNPKLWAPGSPFRYRMVVKCGTDTVEHKFGIREFGLSQEAQPRLTLNGKPIFLFGPLDQGYWPDGLLTPPTEAAMRYDLEVTQRLGFNTIRKHVKVESARWYDACDEMGLIVLQDMPSGDKSIAPSDPDLERTLESAAIYNRELTAMIAQRRMFTSIAMWVVFNEGWGQFDTARVTNMTKRMDPTRWVNSASGWSDRGTGDVYDIHVYPGPAVPAADPKRALLLGEYGGLGLRVDGHLWQADSGWGYRSYASREALADALRDSFFALNMLRGEGLSGAIYTQTTDVETEVNGLMTYDREVIKVDEKQFRAWADALHGPIPKLKTVVETSEKSGQTWRYTKSDPGANWMKADFDDKGWKEGQAGFGSKGTPGAVVRTEWTETGSIWIRRKVEVAEAPKGEVALRVHHDEDAEVYLNGELAVKLPGFSDGYKIIRIPTKLAKGPLTIAVKCTQTRGGQNIDVGLVELDQ